MKENSIEEDIAITKKLITTKFNNDYSIDNKDKEAIEHILTDYKRVLKDNEYMHNELNKQQTTINKYAKENEELKNNTRKNENELEFDIDCDWIALQKMLDESEKNNEYISYKNEKWIKEKYCIPVQKVKDKIRKNEEIIDISNDGDLIHELLHKNKVYEELLESEE